MGHMVIKIITILYKYENFIYFYNLFNTVEDHLLMIQNNCNE